MLVCVYGVYGRMRSAWFIHLVWRPEGKRQRSCIGGVEGCFARQPLEPAFGNLLHDLFYVCTHATVLFIPGPQVIQNVTVFRGYSMQPRNRPLLFTTGPLNACTRQQCLARATTTFRFLPATSSANRESRHGRSHSALATASHRVTTEPRYAQT